VYADLFDVIGCVHFESCVRTSLCLCSSRGRIYEAYLSLPDYTSCQSFFRILRDIKCPLSLSICIFRLNIGVISAINPRFSVTISLIGADIRRRNCYIRIIGFPTYTSYGLRYDVRRSWFETTVRDTLLYNVTWPLTFVAYARQSSVIKHRCLTLCSMKLLALGAVYIRSLDKCAVPFGYGIIFFDTINVACCGCNVCVSNVLLVTILCCNIFYTGLLCLYV
jgi:hypothetical protein